MQKVSITGLEARTKAIDGMSYVASAVRSTLGPFGLNFLSEKGNKITNDGYLISVELCPTIKDEFERRGALVALEASSKTNDMVGDATSTAWVLTEAIVKEAVRYLPNDKIIKAKLTPSEILQTIEKSKDNVVSLLEASAKPIATAEVLVKVALVAVENKEIAKLLGEMQWELGDEGVIIAEEVNETTSSIEKVKGIRLDNGFSTSGIVTNAEKQSLELNDMPVLMTNYTIDITELQALKETVFNPLIAQKKLGLVLIARAFTSEAIKVCMEGLNSGFPIFPVNAPYVDQKEVMKDIESVIGGRYIDVEEARFEDITIGDVGFSRRFVARQFDGVVTGDETLEATERIWKRAEDIKKKIVGSQSEFEKRLLESRVAQLTNGFAILKVGSVSLTNRKRLKDKCDDAVNAVRHALKGGVVKGAGIAFKEISDTLEEGDILKRPLLVVHDTIVTSAPEDWTVPKWVVDPMIVLKTALVNACEFASVFSTVNGIITSENPKECACNSKKVE